MSDPTMWAKLAEQFASPSRDAERWRDPTGTVWSAMLNELPDGIGLHFSVKGNGRRVTDEEFRDAVHAHEDGRWVSRTDRLLEITELRDELGHTVDPHVRQWMSPRGYTAFAEMVASQRAQSN